MKTTLFFGLALLASATAFAQTATVDDFESYTDDAGVKAKYVIGGAVGTGSGATLQLTGGAESTAKSLLFTDGDGFANTLTTPDMITVGTTGYYKLGLYFKNGSWDGTAGTDPMKNLQVFLKQGGNNLTQIDIAATTQTAWTLAESPFITVSNANPVQLYISKNNPSVPVNGSESCQLDQIKLTYSATPPLAVAVSPASAIYLSRTRTITATLSAGSGSFTSVEFDAGNDSTIDGTDTVAPFTFDWNTLVQVPQGTRGPASIRVIGHDSAGGVVTSIMNYSVVDNRWGGREAMATNGTFDAWSAGLPTGWERNDPSNANATVSQDTTPANQHPGAVGNSCVKINFTAGDYTNRYTLRTTPKQGKFIDLQACYWGKGASNRMMWFTGAAPATLAVYIVTPAAAVNNASWTYAAGTPMTITTIGDLTYVALCTHNFTIGNVFFDDVFAEAMKDMTSGVDNWNLY